MSNFWLAKTTSRLVSERICFSSVGVYGSGALHKHPQAPISTHNGCLCTMCSLSDQTDLTTILFSLYVFVSVFEPTSVVLFPSAILSQQLVAEAS